MRLRRWFYAIASVFAVALVMFPLNFLWVGQSPLHAAVSSLLFGLPALLSAWTPKERRTGRRNESRGTAVCAQSRRCAGAGIHAAPAGRIDSAANAGAAMPAGVARCSESAGRAGAERFGESAAHPESCGPHCVRGRHRTRPAEIPVVESRAGDRFLCAGGDAGVRYCDRRRGRRCYEIGRIRPVDIGCRIGK